jgi:DNA-directed RNA polymerase specialized sigma24 family protein
VANRERAQAVRAAVAQLSPKQRQAIQLVYFDKLQRAQAAIMANCNEAVLRWRLADARARLRQLLGHIQSHRTRPGDVKSVLPRPLLRKGL